MDDQQIVVTNNEAEERYEVNIDDYIAVLTYSRHGNTINFLHTGVPEALEGHGVASHLAHSALEEAKARHLHVIPSCPFVAAYIRRHQEYLPLLPAAEQKRVMEG